MKYRTSTQVVEDILQTTTIPTNQDTLLKTANISPTTLKRYENKLQTNQLITITRNKGQLIYTITEKGKEILTILFKIHSYENRIKKLLQ